MKKSEEEIKTLRNKYPSVPDFALPKTRNKKNTPAGELQHQIIKVIESIDGFVQRINTTGTWNKKLGKFMKSGSTKGASDLIATLQGGFTVHIEVKAGKDKERPSQAKFKEAIQKAGGTYITVRTIDDFKEQLNLILLNIK